MAEIRLRSLAHSYERQPKGADDYAIRQLDHVWHKGGAYALLGPSGCGKSTMLNIISGLLQPSEGDVLFDGERVNELSPRDRNIAQVFQFPVVYDSMTVFDNLAFPLRNSRVGKARIQARVEEIAGVLELENLLNRKARNLTADEKQKVSMGRGLVREDVSAILFDEPLTVIDPQLKWKLRRKLKEIHEQFDITMIYVTHDQLEASTFADKIAVMYEGRIVQFGTPTELFENPNHTFVGFFIGSPGMNLIAVERCDGGVRFGDTTFPLSPTLNERLGEAGSTNIKVGIRPEFLQLAEADSDTYPARAMDVEDLGTYQILSVNLDGQILKARLSEDARVSAGDMVHLRFPAGWLKVYVDDYLIQEGSA
ncbi:carbohydrate ABC transporter ATP-binding protein, CUT1 family [Marinobacter daqiaonensis]|uniref:Carbohydrate ABC transporter ATP-binding protein, CUT1 family n=1 Tax=Marinobacter daqiaonensis TaxID=650891 RepID=A0A1I6J6X0_9GAMM|nr:ABC transporter ATP-binding protein [Marinobacter daqiaonensis]SFR74270.1 carbohydrate ABC transporter ATP-binding protein, CUT1 family [Marinobacter daqiaonensis]